jgi:transposase
MLKDKVEKDIGEKVDSYLSRKAEEGKTIRDAAGSLDVSYSTCWRWVHHHGIKFRGTNPFKNWRM